jgi:hypothetical protein
MYVCWCNVLLLFVCLVFLCFVCCLLKITNRFNFHCKSIYMTAKILNFNSRISRCKHTLRMSTQNSWFKFVYIRESVPRMLLPIITSCKKPLMADFRNFQPTTHMHKFISRKSGYFSTKISSKSMCIAILCILICDGTRKS